MDFLALLYLLVAVLFFVSAALIAVIFVRRGKTAMRKYEMLLNTTDSYVLLWRTDFEGFETNNALDKLLNETDMRVGKQLIQAVFGTENAKSAPEMMVRALSTDGLESVFIDRDNHEIKVKWFSEVVETSGNDSVIISIGDDITDKAAYLTEIDTQKHNSLISQENFTLAMESAGIGFVSIITEGFEIRVEMSANARRMLGFLPEEELTLEKIAAKVYPSDEADYSHRLNQLFVGSSELLNLEVKMQVSPTVYHSFILKFKCLRDANGNLMRITGAFIDVTSQRENYSLYDRSEFEDMLTGLPNRRAFMKQGTEFLNGSDKKHEKCALLSIHAERIQKITALFGIEIADNMLKMYADCLVRLTKNKAIVGKLGLEDYVVLMHTSGREHVERFAKELQIIAENACGTDLLPAILKEQCRFVVGVCFYDYADDITTLYNKASITLYTRNAATGVCSYFDESIEKKVCEREIIEQEIGDAMKDNQFELYYQPKISFRTGKILGCEALIRWKHPDKGLISPDEFIPIAEEVGIITRIDEWGLIEACTQNKRWQKLGYLPIKVSCNMSQAQLYRTDVVTTIKNALSQSQLDPRYLEVELTETMAIQDMEQTITILNRIKELGVSISMDDFGTGYSSLSSLKVLPIDVLKIDKSLVYDIGDNDTARQITKAIVELGKAMNLTVLAEGVETQEQCDLLENLGCDIAQGFFYGKPLTPADMERMFLMNTRKVNI